MRGGKTLADRGVIPRLLSAIYRRCKKVEKDSAGATKVEVALEYFEIYCDRVYDLFEPPEKRTASGLPIRDSAKGKTVVVGLTEKPCATLKEFEQLYDQANVNRSTSATKVCLIRVHCQEKCLPILAERTLFAITCHPLRQDHPDNRRHYSRQPGIMYRSCGIRR